MWGQITSLLDDKNQKPKKLTNKTKKHTHTHKLDRLHAELNQRRRNAKDVIRLSTGIWISGCRPRKGKWRGKARGGELGAGDPGVLEPAWQ